MKAITKRNLKINPDVRKRFNEHRNNARMRGIEFLLTIDEWCQIWFDSGHWHERGRQRGQYCMARFGDKGSYAASNVKIILHSDNVKEEVISEAGRQKLVEHGRSTKGFKHSEEFKKWQSEQKKGRKTSPRSEETKRRISQSLKGKTKGIKRGQPSAETIEKIRWATTGVKKTKRVICDQSQSAI